LRISIVWIKIKVIKVFCICKYFQSVIFCILASDHVRRPLFSSFVVHTMESKAANLISSNSASDKTSAEASVDQHSFNTNKTPEPTTVMMHSAANSPTEGFPLPSHETLKNGKLSSCLSSTRFLLIHLFANHFRRRNQTIGHQINLGRNQTDASTSVGILLFERKSSS
jgi:hypothetical protein